MLFVPDLSKVEEGQNERSRYEEHCIRGRSKYPVYKRCCLMFSSGYSTQVLKFSQFKVEARIISTLRYADDVVLMVKSRKYSKGFWIDSWLEEENTEWKLT